ncbi:LOW QUALITY PROTEIN: CMRF35-like molecule 6 [Phacochoerus africanus]|uniref:LOW QUALITY PROTEIN: CMRF35-like molecule 6 n=1 Tax=Phacochoerus africanus TaxID=41426 RepID=UPI001FD878B2|nr:LOW QUALITY PROTEIN: CMRF35-like molecule 6 [Phacochoerus africanus]
MTPRAGAVWLPSALLLLQVPGYLSLSDPPTVTGIEGGSLSVQCRYEEEYIDDKKYWEKLSFLLLWNKIVETRESAREVRRGRVSIKDDPANLTFTVTLERLTEEDAGTYRCGISTQFSVDSTFPVEVVVFPAPGTSRPPSTPGPPTTLPATTWSVVSGRETMANTLGKGPASQDPGQHPRSKHPSVRLLLLVFLEVPLFLGMLGAVLWVHRPLRSSESRSTAMDPMPGNTAPSAGWK